MFVPRPTKLDREVIHDPQVVFRSEYDFQTKSNLKRQ